MESLANNHPFVDGNKRVAFAVTDAFLRMNGHFLDCDSDEAYATSSSGCLKPTRSGSPSYCPGLRSMSSPFRICARLSGMGLSKKDTSNNQKGCC